MKHFMKQNRLFLLSAFLFSVFYIFPWIISGQLGIEHDTFFHLSRIEGYASSIQEGNLFPAIYPYKNHSFGYASPLFYCDLFLLLPALAYLLGVPLMVCYMGFVLVVSFLSCFFMERCLFLITKRKDITLLFSFAYLFSNYRITDTYVRSALGELTAMIWIPLLLEAIYYLFEAKQLRKGKILLTISITGTILSHNITFLLLVLLLFGYLLLYHKSLTKEILVGIVQALGISFLLTAWFTLPMLEQLSSQSFYVHLSASNSDLSSHSLPLFQYLQNQTIFGYSGNYLPPYQQMTLNIGWLLTFSLMFVLLLPKEKRKNAFFRNTFLLTILCLILPSKLIPWGALFFARIIQFPWRILTITLPLSTVSGAYIVSQLSPQRNWTTALLFLFLILEGIFHLTPVLQRPLTISSKTTYQELIDGSLIDPYYSATYVRVECAGGDYLPMNSPDFRHYSTAIKTSNKNDTNIPHQKNGTTLSFSISTPQEYVLPITWYKGYQVFYEGKAIPTCPNQHAMVTFLADKVGSYECRYVETAIQKGSKLLSLCALGYVLFLLLKRR